MERKSLFKSESSAKILCILALPMIVSNLLQQLYNLVDSYIVSRYIGVDALAAVGVSFAILVFLNSFIIGLSLGCNVAMSQSLGSEDRKMFFEDVRHSFYLSCLVSSVLVIASFLFLDLLLDLMRVEARIRAVSKEYLSTMLIGVFFVSLYNYFSAILRAVGDTISPLISLVFASILNIGLDLLFILKFSRGIRGAAEATIISQFVSSLILFFVVNKKVSEFKRLREKKAHRALNIYCIKRIFNLSILTAVQQSIMNFGILMIQSLINSYGFEVTAAFTAAVRIDAFAYMPAQDFSNAYSTYAAYLYGAKRKVQFKKSIKLAFSIASVYCLIVTFILFISSNSLVRAFLPSATQNVWNISVEYLKIVSFFYFAIAWLFLWYGLFRAISDVKMSIILTIISLGLRVSISYFLHNRFGLTIIFYSIPIGWVVADLVAYIVFLQKMRDKYLSKV